MAENKIKMPTNRMQMMGEKSPPTKLLINHGKPNFTITKSPKTKENSMTDSKQFFQSPAVKPNFIIKRAPQIKQNGTPPSDNEFKRLHKKISGKHIDNMSNNNNSDDIKINGNSDHYKENGEMSISKINLPKEQHFATLQKNCLITVKCKDGDSENHKNDIITKPPTPEKPIALRFDELKNTPNGHNMPIQQKLPKTPITPSKSVPPLLLNNGIANFEQRTMISFAKDLSVEPNRYPDTVKITKNVENIGKPLPKEFNELKFQIAENGEVLMPIKKIVHA